MPLSPTRERKWPFIQTTWDSCGHIAHIRNSHLSKAILIAQSSSKRNFGEFNGPFICLLDTMMFVSSLIKIDPMVQKKNLECCQCTFTIWLSSPLEQEAHGPHHSPEKTVLINKHLIISYHWKWEEKKQSFNLWEFNCSSFENIEFPSFNDALCHDWLKLAQQFWRRKFKFF